MKRIFTIGYEGLSLAEFTETLKRSRVTLLLDVRELPLSRRRGFSKNALRQALHAEGIGYRHEKLLGSPRDIRHQLRKDWDYRAFFKAFRTHLRAQTPLLKRLADELTGNVVLLCYERNHEGCHRSEVANALAKLSKTPTIHLEVGESAARQTHKAPNPRPRKSVSPA